LHTKPGSNHFSSIHRFSKSHVKQNKPVSYTDRDEFPSSDSDSESFESGGNSLKTRALVRLHNACVSLGAAPCWPDWLDTRCVSTNDLLLVTMGLSIDALNFVAVLAVECRPA
jgi:hypothetical protein